MAVSEKKKISNAKWDAANLDRISIAIPKGQKAQIKAHAESCGESVNAFIGRIVNEAIAERNIKPCDSVLSSEGVNILPTTLKAATDAANAAGENVPQFIDRAVTQQADRDRRARALLGQNKP